MRSDFSLNTTSENKKKHQGCSEKVCCPSIGDDVNSRDLVEL